MNNNKKSVNNSIIICILIILIIPTIASTVSAWDNCPFGEVNDAFPGDCGRYIDTDGDGICDLSQPAPIDRIELQEENNEYNDLKVDTASNNAESGQNRTTYCFIPITVLLVTFYVTSLMLSKKKIIKTANHRKIWNMSLLITFLISGIFGIFLAIIVSYNIRVPYYSDLLFWHVEFGISMAIISIFHITWHWRYFKKMIIRVSSKTS